MSRTDKTKPLWVALADGDHHSAPWHWKDCVHRGGTEECTLPDKPGPQGTRCYWMFRYTGKNICACVMCAMKGWYDKPGKHERRERNRQIQEQLRDLN